MAVKRSGLGKGLDSLIPKRTIEKEEKEEKPEKPEKPELSQKGSKEISELKETVETYKLKKLNESENSKKQKELEKSENPKVSKEIKDPEESRELKETENSKEQTKEKNPGESQESKGSENSKEEKKEKNPGENQESKGSEKTKELKEPVTLKITEIEPNRDQPRKKFDEDPLIELADSIRQYGVLQPLIVQKRGDYFEIIAGERRWRAAKLAGLKEVPVIIRSFSEQQAVEISLIENIQREKLNPIEEAAAYKRLLTEFHLKQDELAERVSKSRTTVTNSMRLLKLDDRVQEMVVDDMISTGHARALLSLEDKDQQYRIATKIFDEKLSVREVEKLIKKLLEKPASSEKKKDEVKFDYIYQDMEEKMKALLGTKVSISHKKNNQGKIVIDYYSNEELERLMDLLRSIPQSEA